MASRLLWRRSATAAGVYSSVLFGVLGSLIAARHLGPHGFGLLGIVLVVAGFFQVLLDLTAEEALVKYGFRYATAGRWGRLRRLFRVSFVVKLVGGAAAAVAICALAPAGDTLFSAHDLLVPLLVGSLLPFVQAPESLAGAVLVVRGRYDLRAAFLSLGMALRLAAFAVGSRYGVTETVVAVVLAQAVSSTAVGVAALVGARRFPSAPPEPLGEDRREIFGFIIQSSAATGVVSLRTAMTPLLLGLVTAPTQVGYFRAAQAPQSGLAALTAPARLILLTEQTRDWERGEWRAVLAGVKRFTSRAFWLMLVVTPPLYWFMPDLIRIFYGESFEPAAQAARFMLLAGALQLVIAWTKSLPVSIGRPGWRIVAHGIETVVLIPLVLALGSVSGAEGAALATLIATAVFAATWTVLLGRLRRQPHTRRAGVAPREAPS
jgi:O-antigen/teichoic acid export membrane protein